METGDPEQNKKHEFLFPNRWQRSPRDLRVGQRKSKATKAHAVSGGPSLLVWTEEAPRVLDPHGAPWLSCSPVPHLIAIGAQSAGLPGVTLIIFRFPRAEMAAAEGNIVQCHQRRHALGFEVAAAAGGRETRSHPRPTTTSTTCLLKSPKLLLSVSRWLTTTLPTPLLLPAPRSLLESGRPSLTLFLLHPTPTSAPA